MICALIIAFTMNMSQVTEASNKLDVLITNAITKPNNDYSKDIEYIRSIIGYVNANNVINNIDSAKIGTIMSLYSQILYEIEAYKDTKDERLLKSMITNKLFADNLLNSIDTNKKGS